MHQKKNFIYLVSAIFSGIIGFVYFSGMMKDFKPENFGLGLNTSVKNAYLKTRPINSIVGNIDTVLNTFHFYQSEKKEIILWFGASQLHTINKLKTGDKLAVEYANDSAIANKQNFFFVQSSSPNASLNDLLIIYEYYRQKNYKPDWLIIPLAYGNLKEFPIQDDLIKILGTVSSNDIISGGKALEAIAKEKQNRINGDSHNELKKYNKNTPQEYIENKIEKYLQCFAAYRNKGKSQAKINALYFNEVYLNFTSFIGKLHTSGSTQRYLDIPEYLIKWNNEALESIIRLAKNDNTKILIYRQPIRPTSAAFYYNKSKYDAYWNEICKKYKGNSNIAIIDLQNIVPQDYWGKTNLGSPDIFHFQNEGHKILGDTIFQFLKLKSNAY